MPCSALAALQALATAGLTDVTVPDNAFLPDNGWLVPQTTAQRILGYVPVALGGTTPHSGAYGHELVSVSGPKGPLSTTAANVFPLGSGGVSFTLKDALVLAVVTSQVGQ